MKRETVVGVHDAADLTVPRSHAPIAPALEQCVCTMSNCFSRKTRTSRRKEATSPAGTMAARKVGSTITSRPASRAWAISRSPLPVTIVIANRAGSSALAPRSAIIPAPPSSLATTVATRKGRDGPVLSEMTCAIPRLRPSCSSPRSFVSVAVRTPLRPYAPVSRRHRS